MVGSTIRVGKRLFGERQGKPDIRGESCIGGNPASPPDRVADFSRGIRRPRRIGLPTSPSAKDKWNEDVPYPI